MRTYGGVDAYLDLDTRSSRVVSFMLRSFYTMSLLHRRLGGGGLEQVWTL
jgi:hypothetical protein